jgi:hypothetical protein
MHDFSHLFRTTDGGVNWQLVNSPGNSQIEVLENTELAFANASEGWMLKDSLGGFTPFIEVTRDGGVSWESFALPSPKGEWEDFDRRCIGFDPHFFGDGDGVFLLNCLLYNDQKRLYDPELVSSYLYRSLDGGNAWQIGELPGQISQLLFLDQEVGYAIGRQIYRTLDRGESWEFVKEVNWDGQFSFISAEEAWAIAEDEGEISLVHTVDGGESFEIIVPVLE